MQAGIISGVYAVTGAYIDRARNDPDNYGMVRCDALEALAFLAPTPELGSIARQLMSQNLISFDRTRLQRLIAIIWPEEPAEPSGQGRPEN